MDYFEAEFKPRRSAKVALRLGTVLSFLAACAVSIALSSIKARG